MLADEDKKPAKEIGAAAAALANTAVYMCRGYKQAALNLLDLTASLLRDEIERGKK